ncbi:S-layer homology domain-containing protein [Brevibacillus daliensis]|uniref:S-layer homology domain-containing protein n=1 Tax=Brevibacillus daliensis TaxID=2892995 RepID=UPI001E5AC5E9|nr:S-layer homology domain-containing protein [Brevibacillus daliensis]
MKRITSLLLAFVMVFALVPAMALANTPSFWDVPKNHWAYEAITEMAKKGIIDGYRDGSFRPDEKVSRAEFAKIMIAASGVKMGDKWDIDQTFRDVTRNHWAFTYVEYAKPYLTGYKSGSSYYYKPDQSAVREDIAVAMVRLLGYDQSKTPNLKLLNKFDDEHKISNNLRSFIAIALETELIKGFNDDTFRPQNAITRAEAASLLYRAKLDEQKVVFPVDPTKPKPEPKPEPEKKIEIKDDFSDDQLKKWKNDKGTGSWATYKNRVTAYSNDDDLVHYLLPLNWAEDKKYDEYEMSVTITPENSKGFAGLFFDMKDDDAKIVYLTENGVQIHEMEDADEDDTDKIASVSVKMNKSNTLTIKVKGDSYTVYVNGKHIYDAQNQNLDGARLGLYLNKNAVKQIPTKTIWFDNFSFKTKN